MAAAPKKFRLSGTHARRIARLSVVATIALVVAFVAMGWWLLFANQSHVLAGRPAHVDVKAGQSTRQIAHTLADKGVIGNVNGFALLARLTFADGKLQPGSYDLETGMSSGAAIKALMAGPPIKVVTVTIPEGFRVDQIAQRMHDEVGVSKSAFLKLAEGGAKQFAAGHPYLAGAYKNSLEGYLFPKTYEIAEGSSASGIIEMMLDQFDRETERLDFSAAQQRNVTPAEVVVIASMIERESKLDRERPLVSAVIYNRLRVGMRLKIDATIEYVLRDNRLRLTSADLYTPTPYNTYLHKGLPRGPISNPGLASLQAAAHPADSAFLYYVLTGKDGSHTFTTNLADFLVAKKKSKEVFGR